MKIYFMLSLFTLLYSVVVAQPSKLGQDRFQTCLSSDDRLQRHLQSLRDRYTEQLANVRASVDRLIIDHAVGRTGSGISLKDLRSLVELSMQLRDLDAECDSAYFELRESVLSEAWSEGICVGEYSFDQYQVLLDNYLEDVSIRPVDHYAATYFATALGFRSMLLIQLQKEEEWLEQQGLEWRVPHPFTDLPIGEEMYWAVLDADWSIDLRDPEPQLANIQLGERSGGEAARMKFKDVLLFILKNWDDWKDILNWLEESVFFDCSPTVTARIKSDTRDVNEMQQLSPELERRIYYEVGQRGVRADFRSTRTRIWGKAHLYKRKRNRFVKDKTQVIGIAYCTQQWNVCDDRPWPSNGQPFQFGGVHRRGKVKFSERHPYALSIQQTNTEFINFPIFYKRALVDQVYLLGNGGCF